MKKHTPGPWQLNLGIGMGNYTCIAETRRNQIYGIYEPEKSEKDNQTAYSLDEANALLIAAAPENLDAHKALLEEFCLIVDLPNIGDVISIEKYLKCMALILNSQNAIAKSEGDVK